MNPIITYMALHELNKSLKEIYHHDSDSNDYLPQTHNLAVQNSDNNNFEADIFQSSTIIKQNIRSLT